MWLFYGRNCRILGSENCLCPCLCSCSWFCCFEFGCGLVFSKALRVLRLSINFFSAIKWLIDPNLHFILVPIWSILISYIYPEGLKISLLAYWSFAQMTLLSNDLRLLNFWDSSILLLNFGVFRTSVIDFGLKTGFWYWMRRFPKW